MRPTDAMVVQQKVTIEGSCHDRFAPVREAFANNLETGQDIGASVAIIFATSGKLTRRWLVERGVTRFTPSSDDLLTRAWPAYRAPIERHWFAYLDGKGTLEEAMAQVVGALPPPKK